MKKIIKKASNDEPVVSDVTAKGIKLSNIGLLKEAIAKAGKAYSISSVFGSFLPKAREDWANYQILVVSSEGLASIPVIDDAFADNDFHFCFNEQEVCEEVIDNDKKVVLGLSGIVPRDNKIKTYVSGGWFVENDEFKFALLLPKPQRVFTRYTVLLGSQLGIPQPTPTPPDHPSTQKFPTLVMDEYTRSKYHYPMIFAKEFYAQVVAKYCLPGVDKFIIPKCKYIPKLTGRSGDPDEKKSYSLAQRVLSTGIDMNRLREIYNAQSGSISEQMRTLLGTVAQPVKDLTNPELFSSIARSVLRSTRGQSRTDVAPLQRQLDVIDQRIKQGSDIGLTDSQIAALRNQREQLQTQIDLAGRTGMAPAVFTVGQTIPPTTAGQFALDARTPRIEEILATTNAELESASNSTYSEDVAMLNLPAALTKTFSVDYRLHNAPADIQAREFPQENRMPTHAFSFNFTIGGAFYIEQTNAGPRIRKSDETPEVGMDFRTYDSTRNIDHAAELSEEMQLFAEHILKARTSSNPTIVLNETDPAFRVGAPDSIRKQYEQDISDLKRKISEIINDSYKYDFVVNRNIPEPFTIEVVDGKRVKRMMSSVEYLFILDEFLSELKLVAPKSLAELSDMLDKKKPIKKSDVSLIRIILEK